MLTINCLTVCINVRRILVRGSMPPCCLRRRKFDYKMVHSPPPPFRKVLFFACFRFLIFYSFFPGGSADPICPYVWTPMTVCYVMNSMFCIRCYLNVSALYTALELVVMIEHFLLTHIEGILSTDFFLKTFIHRKYGRYRQDTDMYKRQKQNNNTQYTLQQGNDIF